VIDGFITGCLCPPDKRRIADLERVLRDVRHVLVGRASDSLLKKVDRVLGAKHAE
jgi:hypothetical protein